MQIPDSVKKAYKAAVKVRLNSYSPYSKFKVGAAIITSKDKIYSGTNVENASYGGTVCAERIAIFEAVKNSEKKIAHVVVVTDTPIVTSPCGMCRQVIAEFANTKTKVWLANLEGIQEVYRFEELLPHAFTPKSLK